MTQGAEIFAFCDHFPDWEPSNLNGAQESDKLRLPCWTPPKITYPSTGQLKVCKTKEENYFVCTCVTVNVVTPVYFLPLLAPLYNHLGIRGKGIVIVMPTTR